MSIGQRAKLVREKAGLSIPEVSRAMIRDSSDAPTEDWLRLLEAGHIGSPGGKPLLLLARALGVDLTWLLEGDRTGGDAA